MNFLARMHIRLNIPLLDRLRLSGTTTLLITAILVGGGTGLGAVGFIKLIALVQELFFGQGERFLGFLAAVFLSLSLQ